MDFKVYHIEFDTPGPVLSVKGPSIKDGAPEGERGGTKNAQKVDLRSLVDLGRQGEGGYPRI